jgi:hypothetical protein
MGQRGQRILRVPEQDRVCDTAISTCPAYLLGLIKHVSSRAIVKYKRYVKIIHTSAKTAGCGEDLRGGTLPFPRLEGLGTIFIAESRMVVATPHQLC